jgi:hypothetical protein
MQAQKAFDSPRRAIRGAVADLQDRLKHSWPKGRTALPPKREIILTPLNATYKGRRNDIIYAGTNGPGNIPETMRRPSIR